VINALNAVYAVSYRPTIVRRKMCRIYWWDNKRDIRNRCWDISI